MEHLVEGVEQLDWPSQFDEDKSVFTCVVDLLLCQSCGQSYKQFTLVIYNSRVVPDLKIPHITTLDS